MSTESSVMRIFKYDYMSVGLNIENTYKKTDLLLKLYRKVNWSISGRLQDLDEMTYDGCFGDTESLSYLLNFAPDKELEAFKTLAENVMQTRILIDLIDKSILRVKNYPDTGNVYYSIFDLRYLNRWSYTENEVLEMLNLERSTFYRRKKEATYLLGYIFFGFVMPEYISNDSKVAKYCD